MDQRILDITNIQELRKELTTNEVAKLRTQISVPAGICDEDCDGITFLFAILNWNGHNPYTFYQALKSLNLPHILTIAMKVPRLCVSEPVITDLFAEPLSMKTFLTLLRTEISQKDWQVIAIGIKDSKYEFESIIKECLESRLINKDLILLEKTLRAIDRLDVATRIREYQSVFIEMSDEEFTGKMKKALTLQGAEIRQWENKLKQFLSIRYTMVTQMLGDDEEVSLSSVYIDLTIVKEEPRPVKLEDETTYNEIAYLRKIAKKEIDITPVDFTEELKLYKTEEPEIWCLIGNPGCGKTFLTKRIALIFSQYELKEISYSIAIPCRNTDWHSMEAARVEEDKAVTREFVEEWLCLGLPVTSGWAKELAKHLAKSDGEGLLLIIDGVDEFTKKIPFDKSLLYLLLTRQTLHSSTIIVTTRPGAWTDISSQHKLKVNRFYQVLGFSPENRDKYFAKQILKLDKLEVCKNLLSLYDEMDQLSLIPVNASLFAALLKEESVTINTLTQLYRELTCYLIRRQLSRMGLRELSKVKKLESFDECVLDCLNAIGRIALIGVAGRELTSTERVTITIDHEEIECQCLGLAHEFHTKESDSTAKKVWAFAHLTMQELCSAIFLRSTSWTDQCMSARYIADSIAHFYVFRMVVRFLCGLLSERSAAVLAVLFRKLIPDTIDNIPMYHQFKFDRSYLLPDTGWYEFTNKYFNLIPILSESNSTQKYLKRLLPTSISLYLNEGVLPVSPNEWQCFIQSLQLVQHINILYIDTSDVSIEQFASLLKEMRNYPLSQLAVMFEESEKQTEPMSSKLVVYTNLINNTVLNDDTRISIELNGCKIDELKSINLFSSSTSKHINSLRLSESECSTELLHQLANSVVLSEYLQYLYFHKQRDMYILLPLLTQATQLKGLYWLFYLCEGMLQKLLPKLTQLTEIEHPFYSLLPHMAHLTALTYLNMKYGEDESLSENLLTNLEMMFGINNSLSVNLLQVLNSNHNTLRVVKLWYLEEIGFKRWTEFLSALQCCVNLVKLDIYYTTISSEEIYQWADTLRCLQSLVDLLFYKVTLFDAGLLAVCQGLAKHRCIRRLVVRNCEQTSESCEALMNLIPTTRQLELLVVDNLSQPDPVPITALELVAEEYSIFDFID